jgi:hypothetical protein
MSEGIALGTFALTLAICIYVAAEHLRNMDRREKCHRCRDTLHRLSDAWRRIVRVR